MIPIANVINHANDEVSNNNPLTTLLNLLKDIQFLRGLFIIIFVAMLLNLFELGFFLLIIEPIEQSQIMQFIQNNKNYGIFQILLGSGVSGSGSSNNNDPVVDVYYYINKHKNNTNDALIDALNILNIRENAASNKLNIYSIVCMIFIVILLNIILYRIYVNIKILSQGLDDGSGIISSLFTSLLTIIIIGIFQYNMFQFGLRFQYPDSNEIMSYINGFVLGQISNDQISNDQISNSTENG